MHRCLILVLLIGICGATNYITNGDFEQEFTNGWLQSIYGTAVTITRGTGYDPDPDYEAYLYKGTGTSGHAMLYQTVDIPTIHIDFSVQLKCNAWDNYTGAWAAAGVIVGYLDESNVFLGDTRICMYSPDCPWQNSATCHIIDVNDTQWHDYEFNINEELANLPGIDPLEVKKIKVTLIDSVIYC